MTCTIRHYVKLRNKPIFQQTGIHASEAQVPTPNRLSAIRAPRAQNALQHRKYETNPLPLEVPGRVGHDLERR